MSSGDLEPTLFGDILTLYHPHLEALRLAAAADDVGHQGLDGGRGPGVAAHQVAGPGVQLTVHCENGGRRPASITGRRRKSRLIPRRG